jgi:hypothetical protein
MLLFPHFVKDTFKKSKVTKQTVKSEDTCDPIECFDYLEIMEYYTDF